MLPYSAVQLFSYDFFKTFLKGKNPDSLSAVDAFLRDVVAGGAAGMFSTWVTYPLDVMRLRLAVDNNVKNGPQVLQKMLKEEGVGAFYKGLVPSLVGIAPYLALNLAIFDLVKNNLPPEYANHPAASVFSGLVSATFATTACYPLDTIRRQMQMKTSTAKNVPEAIAGVLKNEGIRGLYRGARSLLPIPPSPPPSFAPSSFPAARARCPPPEGARLSERRGGGGSSLSGRPGA